jgi:hypothetical protein
MARDFAETGHAAASNVPNVNEKAIVRRDIMVWPFPVQWHSVKTADEGEFLTRPANPRIMILNPAINIERNGS